MCHAMSGWIMPLRRRAAAFAAFAVRKTVGAGLMALAGAAVLGAAAGPESWVASAKAAVLVPDPVFTGSLTAAQQAEMMAWGQAYFNRIEGVNQGGSNAATAAWNFATPAMNSPLFNPFYGPRQTLVNLGQVGESDCFKALVEAPGTDAVSQARRSAIKDALIGFTIKTDPVMDPNGTASHIVSILDAAYVAGLVTYTQDGKLVSEKLPLAVLQGAGVSVQFADNLSESSVTALLVLTSQAPGIVVGAVGVTEAEGMVGGQGTKANAVAAGISAMLNQAGTGGAAVLRMDAIFGVYGQLPVVYVALSDCAVLVDATTGAVSTPIKLGSPLDASGLLAQHPDAAASPFAHRMMSAAGCTTIAAPSWTPGPVPAGYTPRPAKPPGAPQVVPGFKDPFPPFPWTPAIFPMPKFNPSALPNGWTSDTVCVTAAGFCVCVTYKMYTSTTPGAPIIYERTEEIWPRTVCGGTGTSSPSTTPGTTTVTYWL